jgi:hypothetical protein
MAVRPRRKLVSRDKEPWTTAELLDNITALRREMARLRKQLSRSDEEPAREQDIDAALERVDLGIAEEKKAMGELLAQLRTPDHTS